MSLKAAVRQQLRIERRFAVQFVSIVVAAHGLFILATTLLDQLSVRHGSRISDIDVDLPIMIGVSLLYLSTLLRRRKRTAWSVTVLAYTFYLGLNIAKLLGGVGMRDVTGLEIIRAAIVPMVILGLLLRLRAEFVVRSDIQGFRWAARFTVIMLAVALIYGVAGFMLLDRSDFHQEISPPTALHYTVDRFDLTTNRPLKTYTKRARLFVDSLTVVSIGAIVYAAASLFQPIRLRLSDQGDGRRRMSDLLSLYGGTSEDFFKLWPHDKQYYFSETSRSGLAFHVYHGVALCLGDPAGDKREFKQLLSDFQALCFGNDWLPAFIHVTAARRRLYESQGYGLQKIGQEAILDIEKFQTSMASNKYFRQIRNKFTKQNFTCELLKPPHHPAVLERLSVISADWLQEGGRVERGFAMGYFSSEYMQLCPVMVVRDAAGTIQGFVNQLPTEFDKQEANFDLLRHTQGSLGNINDYLLMSFIDILSSEGYQRLNLGLCPLTGLHEPDTDKTSLIDGVLRFAYANGDRFYSFSGLYRFKAKYEPSWRDRYIAYQGGVRGFSRVTNALMRSMRVRVKRNK
jgi:phosphatidylglycerol lysyltransferase